MDNFFKTWLRKPVSRDLRGIYFVDNPDNPSENGLFVKPTDSEEAYEIPKNTNGSNYLIVYGVGTPEENAQEFIEAYNLAKTMPRFLHNAYIDMTTDDIVTIYKGQTFLDIYANNDAYVVATNTVINGPANTITYNIVTERFAKSIRTTLLVAPGYYNFETEFVHNQSGINITSLSGDSDILISSTTKKGYYSFGVFTDYTKVLGINTVNALTEGSIRVVPNLQYGLILEKCKSGNYSYWDGDIAYNYNYYGTFIDCEARGFSFVSGNGGQTLSGVFIKCKADIFSFGYNAIITNATFEDCEGNDYCFGSNDGEFPSTIQNTTVFKNCWAFDGSFGFNASVNHGKYYYCVNTGANSGVFNGDLSLHCSKNGETP